MDTRPLWPRYVERGPGAAIPSDKALTDPQVRRRWQPQADALREAVYDQMLPAPEPGDAVTGEEPPPLAHSPQARAAFDGIVDERMRTMGWLERFDLEATVSQRRTAGHSFDYDPLAYGRAVTYDPLPMDLAPDGWDPLADIVTPPPLRVVKGRGWYDK